ncbi:MAG TPA: O-antigen ligase family protein [Bryobacteraceae bacterium]|nr:O-antigen ligase family protein [Bryobacteraceae bacterium]
MGWLAAAIVFAIPLALAPRLFFYYDVTPKAATLLAAAAVLLLWTALKPKTSLSFMTSGFGRWNAAFTAAFILLTVAAVANSPSVSLAWNGSNWRRWGAVEQIATVVCALLVAAVARSVPAHRFVILRALCGAGVISAVYGIFQYFGLDPLLPAATYLAGEGPYQIVRPPGPLGHSDYFAVFLLWPIFAGTALWAVDNRAGRWLGRAAVLTGVVGLVLSGSRGAFLGLLAGSAILVWLRRPRIRLVAATLAIAAAMAAAFYVSPAGARLRARAFWISEDPAGGARLLLWRDSLHMSAARPWTGFGPDTFVAEFPEYQSAELARAYPDFYHESPHNMFLDALTGQGPAGVLLLSAWIVMGVAAGLRAPPALLPVAGALLASLGAAVVAQQFVVFVIPTAFLFYLGIGLLSGLASKDSAAIPIPIRTAAAVCGVVAAVFLTAAAYRLVAADRALARIRSSLDRGDRVGAAGIWDAWKSRRGAGVTADLYFSRRWAAAASTAQDPLEKVRLGALTVEASRFATTVAEQRQNAWYNFAMLAAAMNDPKTVEASLRSAILAGPRWFKPHWALARLLYSAGRTEEARREAALALDLDGHKDAEVVATMAEIVRSLDSRR